VEGPIHLGFPFSVIITNFRPFANRDYVITTIVNNLTIYEKMLNWKRNKRCYKWRK